MAGVCVVGKVLLGLPRPVLGWRARAPCCPCAGALAAVASLGDSVHACLLLSGLLLKDINKNQNVGFSLRPLQSAVGFEYQGKTEKHASQKGERARAGAGGHSRPARRGAGGLHLRGTCGAPAGYWAR